eukprot:499658-Pyramimonas_sp.AAC.1
MIHSRRHQQYQGDQQDKAESVSIQCGSSSPRVPMVRRFLVGFGSQDLAWGIRRRLLNVSSMIASSLLGFNDLLRTTARVECGSNLLGDMGPRASAASGGGNASQPARKPPVQRA